MVDETDLNLNEKNGTTNIQSSEVEDCSKEDRFYSIENITSNTDLFFSELWQQINSILSKEIDPSLHFNGKSLCNQVLDAYAHLANQWPNCTNSKLKKVESLKLTYIFCEYFQVMEQTAKFCMKLSSFVYLPVDQRKIMYRNFILYFPQMFRVFNNVDWLGHDVTDSTIVTHNGIHYDLKTVEYDTANESLKREMKTIVDTSTAVAHKTFYHPYKRLYADNFEGAFLIARRIWLLEGVEGITDETLKTSTAILNYLSEELHFYYSEKKNLRNYASRICKANNLLLALDKIKKLRIKNQVMIHVFGILKVNHYAWHNKSCN